MAQVQSVQIIKTDRGKQGSVTYNTGQNDEVSRILFITLKCV